MTHTGDLISKSEYKLGKWVFYIFMLFLLITTPTNDQAPIEDLAPIDGAAPMDLFPDVDRLNYVPMDPLEVGGKALSGGPWIDPSNPFGTYGPFLVSTDGVNREALSVDNVETVVYNQAFASYKNINISKVGEPLTDFPVFIKLYDTDLKTDVQSDGDDIAFFNASGAQLDHELMEFNQNFNGTHALMMAWVKTDLSNTTNTILTMRYGHPDLGPQENPAAVWSNGYEAVLHLKETGSGTDDEYRDSSGNAHHGTGGGIAGSGNAVKTPTQVSGIFGYAQEFNDTDPDLIRLDHIADQDWGEITVQAWMNPADNQDDRIFTKAWDTGATDHVWLLGKDRKVKVRHRTNQESGELKTGADWTPNTWTLFVYTWSNVSHEIIAYRDGVPEIATTVIAGTDLYDYTIQPTIGNVPSEDRGFTGRLQEVRLSFVARSAGWLSAEFNNQYAPDTFYSVGSEQALGGSPVAYNDYVRIGNNGSILQGGMLFPLNVPRGAQIDNASLLLYAAGASGTATTVQIVVYDVASAPLYIGQNHTDGLLGHAPTWATTVSWTPPTVANWNGWVTTENVTQLVQHIVDRSDWQAGNYIGFVINGTDASTWWRAWEHYGILPGTSYAPKLQVEYTTPSWWDSNYQQRLPLNVTNNADVTMPVGYSVSFSLNTWYLTNNQSVLLDNGDDLRVVYFNTTSGTWTQLPRVNMTAFNTYKTQIWFPTQSSIPASSSDPRYYVYYDYDLASTPSASLRDPANVFLVYDDFEDQDYSGWAGLGGWSVSQDSQDSGNYILSGDNNQYLYTPSTGSTPYGDVAISALIRWESGDRHRGVSVRFTETSSNPDTFYRLNIDGYNFTDTDIELWRRETGDAQLNSTGGFPGSTIYYNDENWYRYEVAAQTVNTNNVVVRGRVYDANMIPRSELTYLDTSGNALTADGKVSLYGEGEFDNVIIRRFIDPEPTISFDSPLDFRVIMLIRDSTDLGPGAVSGGNSYQFLPFVDHVAQTLGYVVDIGGHENIVSAGDPFLVDEYDAMMISPDISSPYVLSLRDTPIPILTWEFDTWDELYLSSGRASSYSNYQIYVVNDQSYITSGFNNNSWADISSTPQPMIYLTNYTLIPGGSEIELLARTSDPAQALLVALEKDAVDFSPPHTAPERRVYWPAQNGDYITTTGWRLFDQALNWTLYVDQKPPIINDYGHTNYLNGTADFYAQVSAFPTSNATIASVYLNYTVDGTPQTPVLMTENATGDWVWQNTFAYNKEIAYTILSATDSRGNVNASLAYVWDFDHRFITLENDSPVIQSGNYTTLATEDGLLRFWFNATDVGSGLDTTSGLINITIENNSTWTIYPMTYNATDYFTVDVGLPYWYTLESSRLSFAYNFTVSDLSSLSTTGGGDSGQNVPDIVYPNFGNFGVEYTLPIATVWSTAFDGINGSGINTTLPGPGISISYSIQGVSWIHDNQMQWNGSHWEHNVTGIVPSDWFFYFFNATDRSGNSHNSTQSYFDPQDSEPPIINAYGNDYSGDGLVIFWADVTDKDKTSNVTRVDLKYNSTANSVPQIVSMQDNGSLWVWSQYFAWNQIVNYTIALARDSSGNVNTNLANVWDYGLITEDWLAPVVEDSGFDKLLDYDGHLRFYVDLSDYSGIDSNSVYLNLTLPSGGTTYDYPMNYNGTLYVAELGLPYWWTGSIRTTFDYTFTAADIAVNKHWGIDGGNSTVLVPDVVAPSISSHGVDTFPSGQATVWVQAADGVNGSDIGSSGVYVSYSVEGSGPWIFPMVNNGTYWVYSNSSLTHRDLIEYQVNVTDQAAPTNNSYLSTEWTAFYFDVFPPDLTGYGYTQNGAGILTFWATATDDQGGAVVGVQLQYWQDSLGTANGSQIMGWNGTYWDLDVDFTSYWNETGNYTIPQVLDNHGNANTSLNGVWAKNFTVLDRFAPVISNFGYNNLTDRDGHLEFYADVVDTYSGLDNSTVFLNLTISGFSSQLYPMEYDTGDRFKTDLDFPYWQTPGSLRTQINFHFEASDNAGNVGYSSPAIPTVDIPDIIAPTVDPPADHGGIYTAPNVTIWSTALDGANGSNIYINSPPYSGVYLNYSTTSFSGPYSGLIPMGWNGTHWNYTLPGVFSQGNQIFYYINATDYANNTDVNINFWWFTVEDTVKPIINEILATDYGNGSILFTANVSDFSPIQYVELNYTYSGSPYLQNMTAINATHFEYTVSGIPWNTEVKYTIINATDIAGNFNDALSQTFLTNTTQDLVNPVISAVDFDPIPDVNGHIRFYANVNDAYSGLNTSDIFINFTLSSGASGNYSMTSNSTYYIYETNLDYWNTTGIYTVRMNVTSFTVYASDLANNTASPTIGTPKLVPDVVPPTLDDDAGIDDLIDTFWADPQDINGSQVLTYSGSQANVSLYYGVSSSPPSPPSLYTQAYMSWNTTHWIWTVAPLTFDAGDLIYFYVNVTDGAGNTIDNAGTPWVHGYSDTVNPVIQTFGHAYLTTYDGSIRFYANATDNAGVKNVTLDLDISDTATTIISDMPWNGSYYGVNINLTAGHVFNYTMIAYDSLDLPSNSENTTDLTVQDVVAPKFLDQGVEDALNGTITIYFELRDGVNGTGFPIANDTVSVFYLKNGFGPFQRTMNWNGSGDFYAYTISSLHAGDIIEYYVQAEDIATNSRTSSLYQFGVADKTTPTIHTSSHTFLTDADGHISFAANVTEDIGVISVVRVEGTVAGTPFTGIMTFNESYYVYDMSEAFGTVFSYNITTQNVAGLSSQTAQVNAIVADVVAPQSTNFNTMSSTDNQDGTVTFRVSVADGQYGSGIKTNQVYFIKRVGGGAWATHQMAWQGGNIYAYTVGNVFVGDVIDYYVRATDKAGNTGTGSQIAFGVSDHTDPDIEDVGYDYMPDIDGHIQFWCEAEDPFGTMGRVQIDITGSQDEDGTMLWNGDFYYYDVYFKYGNTFNYEITVRDTAGNTDSDSQSGQKVQDRVEPQNENFVIEKAVNNQDGTVYFDVSVKDGDKGSGINPNQVSIHYRFGGIEWQTEQMNWTGGTNYEYSVDGVFVGDVIEYYVEAVDEAGNTGQSLLKTFGVSDFSDPLIERVVYEYLNDTDGHIQFRCYATDPFGTIGRVELKLSGDQTEEVVMLWVGAYYYYNTHLQNGSVFNYEITARDTAGNADSASEAGQIVQDTVPPQIMAANGDEYQNGTAILWAQVEDGEFGAGFPSTRDTVQITYQRNVGFPETNVMGWNPNTQRFEYLFTGLDVGDIIDFAIQAQDSMGNTNTGTTIAYKFAVPDLTPPTINDFGYTLMPEDDGLVQFYVNALDPFGSIDEVRITITINETSNLSKSASETAGMGLQINETMQFNGTDSEGNEIYVYETNLGYQTSFSYSIIVVDGAELQSTPESMVEQQIGDGAPPRVLMADIIDPGDGKLTIWAEIEEYGSGVDTLEVVYSADEGAEQRVPMSYNGTHYIALVEVDAGSAVKWVIASKDLGGNSNEAAWNIWGTTPYITGSEIPIYFWIILIAIGPIVVVVIKKFRSVEVIGLDKERVLSIADQMTDEEVVARLDDHTYGVILSFFDQREGPIPSIITPIILQDHMQFLVDLSDRSFSAGGFVDEVTEERVTIFGLRLAEARMTCISYAFAIDNPEARGGKENMTINLLADPNFEELTNIFSPEILPTIREVRELIVAKAERDDVVNRMEGLRSLVTRIIAAYIEVYGADSILDDAGQVIVSGAEVDTE